MVDLASRILKPSDVIKEENLWEEQEVLSFPEFFKHPDHCGYKGLSLIQEDTMKRFIGEDPRQFFSKSNEINLLVMLWGKGSFSKYKVITDIVTGEKHNLKEWADLKKRINLSVLDQQTGEIKVVLSSVPYKEGTDKFYKVKLKNGVEEIVTDSHQFLTKDGWRMLQELGLGAEIFTDICSVEIIEIAFYKEDEVYDIAIPKYLCYFDDDGVLSHNSGKDWLASVIAKYVTYLLLEMKNPLVNFGQERGFFDIINIAENATQAQEVYFAFFQEEILNWKWLNARYTIKRSNRKLDPAKRELSNEPSNEVNIYGNSVSFPKNISCYSEHSRNEKFEGYSPIFWVMDEASAFSDENKQSNAEKCYLTLRSSARTRFGMRWRGIIMSFPRETEEDDFTIKMYNKAGEDPKKSGMVRSYGCTWEVRPEDTYSPETFYFEGHKVPVDFKRDFEDNPEDSKKKFMCICPKTSGNSFFSQYPQRLVEAFDSNRDFMFEWSEDTIEYRKPGVNETHKFFGKVLGAPRFRDIEDPRTPRAIWIDKGRDNDRCVLAMGHNESCIIVEGNIEQVSTMVVVDLILVWIPQEGKDKIQVSLLNVNAIARDLVDILNVAKIGYDQWQSFDMIEYFKSKRIETIERNLNRDDYTLFRQVIYQKRFSSPVYPIMINGVPIAQRELERLIEKNGKVTHRDGEHDDVAIALCGLTRLLQKLDSKIAAISSKQLPRIVRGGIANMFNATSPFAKEVMSGQRMIGMPETGIVKPDIREALSGIQVEPPPQREKPSSGRNLPRSIRI